MNRSGTPPSSTTVPSSKAMSSTEELTTLPATTPDVVNRAVLQGISFPNNNYAWLNNFYMEGQGGAVSISMLFTFMFVNMTVSRLESLFISWGGLRMHFLT